MHRVRSAAGQLADERSSNEDSDPGQHVCSVLLHVIGDWSHQTRQSAADPGHFWLRTAQDNAAPSRHECKSFTSEPILDTALSTRALAATRVCSNRWLWCIKHDVRQDLLQALHTDPLHSQQIIDVLEVTQARAQRKDSVGALSSDTRQVPQIFERRQIENDLTVFGHPRAGARCCWAR